MLKEVSAVLLPNPTENTEYFASLHTALCLSTILLAANHLDYNLG